MPFAMEVAFTFIAASIKDDVVAEIITERIAEEEQKVEADRLVVARIGFGSLKSRGQLDY